MLMMTFVVFVNVAAAVLVDIDVAAAFAIVDVAAAIVGVVDIDVAAAVFILRVMMSFFLFLVFSAKGKTDPKLPQ